MGFKVVEILIEVGLEISFLAGEGFEWKAFAVAMIQVTLSALYIVCKGNKRNGK